MQDRTELIPVTDLKQWAYCERIVYYHRVMPVYGQPTFKMKEALAAQDLIESLEMRRGLRAYGFEGAVRRFGVWLSNETLGLSAKTDLILQREDSLAVVDFKLTAGDPGENHRMQLAAYTMLAEAEYHVPSPLAFLYRIPDNRIFPIEINEVLRQAVTMAVKRIREMELSQGFPPPTSVHKRCAECEYVNYCADVW
jgi:CRISPR-associated exonuclease Cas4